MYQRPAPSQEGAFYIFGYTLSMFSKENLHHAYFIEGDSNLVLKEIDDFFHNSWKITRAGNPDIHCVVYESFGIDEGRDLQQAQQLRPFSGDKKIFIIVTNSITHEAQNSLLKVFEEPTAGTHFFVISSSQRILLPTLRSRMVVITHASHREIDFGAEANKFMRMSIKSRLEYVSKIVEEKDKTKAEEFLQALVSELSKKGLEKSSLKTSSTIKEIVMLIKYLKDRSSSLKLILERVALLNF